MATVLLGHGFGLMLLGLGGIGVPIFKVRGLGCGLGSPSTLRLGIWSSSLAFGL